MEIKIDSHNANQRIDKLVRKVLNSAPLSFIYKMFRKKDVKVDGKRVDISYIVKEGENVQIYIKDDLLEKFQSTPVIRKVKTNLNIIYEDENICIVNKPKGLIVHGDEHEKRITLQNIFLNYLVQKGEFSPTDSKGFVPGPCHRLDRNTSGIVILGKNLITMQELLKLFQNKTQIKKRYIALLYAKKINKSGEIDLPLLKDSNSGLVRVGRIEKGAKRALTRYTVLKKYGDFALVEAELVTGRTHQLRVHFQAINCPIVGDGKYGNFQINEEFERIYGLKNQFLHAEYFEFLNLEGPLKYLSGKKIHAELPNIEKGILEGLQNEC